MIMYWQQRVTLQSKQIAAVYALLRWAAVSISEMVTVLHE